MTKKIETVEEKKVEIDGEAIAKAIQDIAAGMQSLSKSRLQRKTIVTLIHAHSKVSKKQIEIVLNNLQQFEKLWLK